MPGYQNMEIKIALSGSLKEEKFVSPVIEARVEETLPCATDTITQLWKCPRPAWMSSLVQWEVWNPWQGLGLDDL